MYHTYKIDDEIIEVSLSSSDNYKFGASELLIEKFGDLIEDMPWFSEGYKLVESNYFYNYTKIYESIEFSLKNILKRVNPKISLINFKLDNYHKFVTDEEHLKVVEISRRLSPDELGFDTNKLFKSFSDYFNTNLSIIDPNTYLNQWIILRINRPFSTEFNPAHKDIYAHYHRSNFIPKMVNLWIPVCGVNQKSGLPVAPGSHMIHEDKINKSNPGASLNGKVYSVNSILSWNNEQSMKKLCPDNDHFIAFSSHLIHGLARNANSSTRISLEFRLYKT